ncbi:MAG: 50S ribosomal protein L10 [Acidobacteria bacterium]|nr:50S ribosomal protein L10 [Acidobacteriota bacterium]
MKHEEKQKQVEALREQLKDSKTLILSAFEGLKVSQDVELRRKMRSAGASYKVVKNSLLERAAKGTPAEPVAQDLRGTTSVARTEGDPVALAKLIVAYAKEHPAFTFKAGIVEGRAISLESLKQIASIPSREALYAQIAGVVRATLQRTLSAVNALSRQIAFLVQEAEKKQKFQS